jgi:hypothetical protein
MREKEIWDDYITIDEDGIRHIRDDAPEEAKKAYFEYLKKIEEMAKRGIRIPR